LKPLKLAIPLVVLLALLAGAALMVPKAYRWYINLRYPPSPRPSVGSTNWSAPAGAVAMAVKGEPDWAATELPMSRQDADTKLKNPVASSPEAIAQGKKLFMIYCTPCHGSEGKGDGPVAKRAQFPPPSLPLAAGRRSDGFLYGTIRNGGAIMPSFGHAMSPDERWALVNFLRSIAQAPPPTQPALTSAPGSVSTATQTAGGGSAPTPATSTKGDAAKGKKVFDDACSTCHAADSDEEIVGPGLKNLFKWPPHRGADGRQHDKHTVPVIRKQIIQGGGAMSPMGDSVKGQDLEDLLAYLQTL
jgi:mono/diheme cytochrome c family protein